MAFGAQQIFPSDLDVSQAIGIELPLNGPAVFKSNYQTKDAIKNNLINFFLTNPGERYLNPSFGGGLRAFIFEQISNNSIQTLNEDIAEKLNESFPNINVDKLDILREDDNNTIIVSLTYSVANTNIKDNISIQF
tara:strand:- start:1779 stop:2183 length:405 start_codon:yes stop_codon:yes gene_type:complete